MWFKKKSDLTVEMPRGGSEIEAADVGLYSPEKMNRIVHIDAYLNLWWRKAGSYQEFIRVLGKIIR